jgi:protein tyrosine/serine phosphatase
MRTLRLNYPSALFAAISLLIALSATAVAQESQSNNVTIKNFGQMDDRFFRGGQPKEDEYKELAALGIKTIIDLRDDPKDYEKTSAEALGMRYVNIAMSDKEYPAASNIAEFLKLVDDPSTGKFYVHCAGGRHRTGVMGAVYRFNHYGWDYDRAYAEMKKYDFYSRWGHGDLKKFVQDYAVSFHKTAVAAPAASTHGAKQ